ncbi:glycoside hydrolase family 2 TIM barrel-domain containing protein [Aurantibacter sp.]|uniref:glycoside hydrolase family 2 TIM barrel-domain containing protein n=1 Tax=Aurantibacter sp. TaxID=2807103 RepID=UPI0035C86E79
MVSLNKKLLRFTLIASYIMVTTLIISGISAVFSYLNTGADRSNMLHTEIKQTEHYFPKVIWSPLKNKGRKMDQETLNSLEEDYLNALYFKHVSNKTNTKEGLKDYYTDNARKNLYDIIDLNKKNNINIESTTLNHNISLDFFSEDGQLAVITDKDVLEYKRVLKNEKQILETKELSTYTIVFLLEDGFWRIRHSVKTNVKQYKPKKSIINTDSLKIKGINYYPKDTPWDMFGYKFNKDTIKKDFKIIKAAGLNSVRIFIQYDNFGQAKVIPEKIEKLKQTLDVALETELKVVITLFDFYGDYSILNWTLNNCHAEKIVSTFKNHNAVLAWDIKNEPNLDFESRGKEKIIAWLDQMLDVVKLADPNHPVTIGWSNTQSASILKNKVDLISFHFYEDLANLDKAVKSLKKEVSGKPIVMQEFGISSYSGFWRPFGTSEEDQLNYHKKAQNIIEDNNLQFMSWTLYDFVKVPKSVVGNLPWRKDTQKRFGFIDKDGVKKEAFKYISQK